MAYITPRGSPDAPIWVLIDQPFSTDVNKGYCFSGGMGFAFFKMLSEANISEGDVYVIARRPDLENTFGFEMLEQRLEHYKPPLILTIGEACAYWLAECSKNWHQQLGKYVGSLLRCANLSFSHYMMPLWNMERLMGDWGEREVTASVDLGKIRCELEYVRAHGVLQPLPQRTLLVHDMSTEHIVQHLNDMNGSKAISCDIETVYPCKGSKYYHQHPGLPIVLGFAPSPAFGLSFSPWRESLDECEAVWIAIQSLLDSVGIVIGQNFYNFDALFLNMMVLHLDRAKFQDTLIRHNLLWPELSHKLQFLTRQYTRQPFYKDESAGWNRRGNLTGLRHYNALDCTVTFEVYLGQEEELKQRPHLR